MTDVSIRLSGLPASRVIGSGTLLDTARFRWLLGKYLSISAKSIHAYVVGEHGDSEVLCWSGAMAGSVPISSLAAQVCNPLTDRIKQTIDKKVRGAAYRIIDGKGATWFGIGAGLARLVRAIGTDEHAVLTVSCLSHQLDDIGPAVFSLPRVVGRSGIIDTLMPELSERELSALKDSARLLATKSEEVHLPPIKGKID